MTLRIRALRETAETIQQRVQVWQIVNDNDAGLHKFISAAWLEHYYGEKFSQT